jgi:hypothetical protein
MIADVYEQSVREITQQSALPSNHITSQRSGRYSQRAVIDPAELHIGGLRLLGFASWEGTGRVGVNQSSVQGNACSNKKQDNARLWMSD